MYSMMCRGYVYNFPSVFLRIKLLTYGLHFSNSCYLRLLLFFRGESRLSTLSTFGAKVISLYLLLMQKCGIFALSPFISLWISTWGGGCPWGVWISSFLSTPFSTGLSTGFLRSLLQRGTAWQPSFHAFVSGKAPLCQPYASCRTVVWQVA